MELLHLLNRGFEKRDIVKDDSDRLRFVHSLFIFNDRNYVDPNHRRTKTSGGDRKLLVNIHAWCLMDNHYHLLVSPINEETRNVSLFMKKLNMGYAKYFNERYERSGYLWQGRYKKLKIEKDSHFTYIPYYIHLNPLDYSMPEWRQGQVSDLKKALGFINSYRWSSYLDYSGRNNFASIINRDLLDDIFGTQENMMKNIEKIITTKSISEKSQTLE